MQFKCDDSRVMCFKHHQVHGLAACLNLSKWQQVAAQLGVASLGFLIQPSLAGMCGLRLCLQ